MKATVKIFIFSVLLLIAVFAFPFLASAKSPFSIECDDSEYADAIYFYSYDAKSVLYSKNEKKIITPASTVKIMTGLIACEKLENKLDDTVVIADEMLEGRAGTTMGLKAGMTLRVKDILYGAICGGSNDAAQVLAVICSGSIDDFVREMNKYAIELDMTSTIYKNPTGLDENGAQTTVGDIAILSKIAAKNSLYMKVSSAKNYSYKKDGVDAVIYNRNALISHFTATQYLNEYANGLNAGSTDRGGYVVSTVMRAYGTSYLCIVMGAKNEDGDIYSYKIANELTKKAVATFGNVKISSSGEKITSLPVDCALSTEKEINVSCVTEENVYAFIPKNIDLTKKLEYRAYFHDTELIAPIKEGDVLGGLNIYLDGVLIGSTRIISTTSLEENEFLIFMKEMKGFLLSRYFLIFMVIVAPSLAIYIYIDYTKTRRKNVRYIKF